MGCHASEPAGATWNSTRATPLPGSLARRRQRDRARRRSRRGCRARRSGAVAVDHDRGRRRRRLVADRVGCDRAHLVGAVSGQRRRHDAVRRVSVGCRAAARRRPLAGRSSKRTCATPLAAVAGARRKGQRSPRPGSPVRVRRARRAGALLSILTVRVAISERFPARSIGRGRRARAARREGRWCRASPCRRQTRRSIRWPSVQREVVDARQVVVTDDLQRHGAAEPLVGRRAAPVDGRGARVVVHDRRHDLRARDAEERRADRVRRRASRCSRPGVTVHPNAPACVAT